ncbi:hypothetical protein COHA_000787 [Chlorella ohadii]|uniref:Uncharacterized protein n=1 Tax=Chlorella ohadii TaxID=2649997 RepID=A0AAD5H8S8_9CHLO|nr:hypothetical protein COHA_000787 [Chlorella ohadii]
MSGLPASLRFGPPGARPGGAAAAQRAAPAGGASGKRRDEAPLDDAAAWRAECERAAPQLTIAVPADAGADSRDWRPLLERALAALGSLQAAAPAAQAASTASAGRLTSQLEALAAGEAAAGTQLAGLRAEHKAAQEAVTVLQREVDARQDYVGQLQAELAFLNKDLEERQRELAEQGESMSDTRPVARLAAACQALRGELAQMQLRCGVLQATLLSPAIAK